MLIYPNKLKLGGGGLTLCNIILSFYFGHVLCAAYSYSDTKGRKAIFGLYCLPIVKLDLLFYQFVRIQPNYINMHYLISLEFNKFLNKTVDVSLVH